MDFYLNFNFSQFESGKKVKSLDINELYDIIIIGGGPSALTAAVYSLRKGLKTALISKDIGGQVIETSSVENYLGYKYIEGISLVEKFKEHVEQFDIAMLTGFYVNKIINEKIKKVICSDGNTYHAKALIIATGKRWRKLNVDGEDRLVGKGVAYCAICDAPLFKNKDVVVVGGGNSAVEAAIDLGKIANKVTLVQNLGRLTADKILIDNLSQFSNVEILFEHFVKKINGENFVESIDILDLKNNVIKNIKANGIFIEIGLIPNSEIVKDTLNLNQFGEIIVDCACKTSGKGIFAAGDVTSVPYKQIIIASGEGAKAALSAYEYILSEFEQ